MKILQINCVYKKGSTGKIIYDIHQGLIAERISSVVCYGRGDTITEENVYKVCSELYSKINNLTSRVKGVMYGGCILSTNKLIRIIKKEKPDIVHLHCINGYFVNIYKLVSWLKDHKIPTVLSLHAEFIHTGNCGHALNCEKWKTGCGHCPRLKQETKSWLFDGTAYSWRRMYEAFEGFNDNLIVTSVSPWLMDRAKQSPILSDKEHYVVLNGLDTDVFHPYDSLKFKEDLGISPATKVIFHATPFFSSSIDHIKGGYYVLKLAEELKSYDIKFVVAGNYNASYDYPDNIVMLGKVDNQQQLAKYYSMADVTLLTSKKETFSMVTAESLCCGTPVVGFKAGAPEQIAIPEYSEFVDFGDVNDLKNKVLEMFNRNINVDMVFGSSIIRYSKYEMVQNYINIYKKFNI